MQVKQSLLQSFKISWKRQKIETFDKPFKALKTCDYDYNIGDEFPLDQDSDEAKNWFQKFGNLGFSTETGFDWANVEEQSRSWTKTGSESVYVKPGH